MDRTLDEHKVNPANDTLTISVMDEPGSGGANHEYVVSGGRMEPIEISFQNGPIAESGVNGITQEVLLAIVADRLRGFQSGKFACKANACALTHIIHPQQLANLHLMTAAPVMFDALQTAIGVMKLQRDVIERGANAKAWDGPIAYLEAALSAATGLPQP